MPKNEPKHRPHSSHKQTTIRTTTTKFLKKDHRPKSKIIKLLEENKRKSK